MTKKITLTILLAIMSLSINSQVLISLLLGDKLNSPNLEFGLDGGFNMAYNSAFESSTAAKNLNLGFYFDIRLKNQTSLYTGVLLKSQLGNSKLTANDLNLMQATTYELDGDYKQALKYISVPIFIKYQFKNYMYVEGGPQLGLLRDAWIEYEYSSDDQDRNIKQYNEDLFKKLDAGMTIGTGYKLMKGEGMTIGVKYYYGFVDVIKAQSNSKNSSFYVKVCIPIGKAKAESKN